MRMCKSDLSSTVYALSFGLTSSTPRERHVSSEFPQRRLSRGFPLREIQMRVALLFAFRFLSPSITRRYVSLKGVFFFHPQPCRISPRNRRMPIRDYHVNEMTVVVAGVFAFARKQSSDRYAHSLVHECAIVIASCFHVTRTITILIARGAIRVGRKKEIFTTYRV